MEKIDLYLSRASHIVQIGLFATTLFAIYYTVIPLYKSAQIEESLARKELEYEQLRVKSKSLIDKINKWEYSQFVVAAASCSGLPSVLLGDVQPEIENYSPEKVDICLRAAFDKRKLTDLSSESYMAVQERINRVRPELQSVYREHVRMYDEYPAILDKMLLSGKVPESAINQLDNLVGDLGYKISDQQKRENYIYAGRLEIKFGYFTALSNTIRQVLGDEL